MSKLHAYKNWNLFETIRNYSVNELKQNKESLLSRIFSAKRRESGIKIDRIIKRKMKKNREGRGLTGEKLVNSVIFKTAIKRLQMKNQIINLSNIINTIVEIKDKIGNKEFDFNNLYY